MMLPPAFKKLKTWPFLVIMMFFSWAGFAQITSTKPGNWNEEIWSSPASDIDSTVTVIIQDNAVVIPEGVTAKVADLKIGNGKLIVQGNLIVHGNLTMDSNDSQFAMDSIAMV